MLLVTPVVIGDITHGLHDNHGDCQAIIVRLIMSSRLILADVTMQLKLIRLATLVHLEELDEVNKFHENPSTKYVRRKKTIYHSSCYGPRQ